MIEGQEFFFLMDLAFLPKFLADVHNQAQVLLKRSCTLGKLVNTQIKGITMICTGKNTICISCVFNDFKYITISLYEVIVYKPAHVAQSVTCLATDASLTADPGVASSIPARSHTFVEIDHFIISTVILLPSSESFKKGSCQLQAKVCA